MSGGLAGPGWKSQAVLAVLKKNECYC